MKETLHISQPLRPSNCEHAPKDCFAITGFIAGPLDITSSPHVRSWCAWPYQKHPRGCPNLTLRHPGCPSHPDTVLFDRAYYPTGYLVAVIGDFGAYCRARYSELQDKGYTSKAIKNKRWWEGILTAHLTAWQNQLAGDCNGLSEYVLVNNPEALGINLKDVCHSAGVSVIRLATADPDYSQTKPTFSSTPETTLANCTGLSTRTVLENPLLPAVEEIVAYNQRGGFYPMWRIGILAAKIEYPTPC